LQPHELTDEQAAALASIETVEEYDVPHESLGDGYGSPILFSQVEYLRRQPDDQEDKETALSAQENRGLQISHQRVPVRYTT